MIIYQWSGQGRGFMSGVSEYIELAESKEEFIEDAEAKNEKEAIKMETAPGFTFDQKYDTDTDTDFSGLPMLQQLISKY